MTAVAPLTATERLELADAIRSGDPAADALARALRRDEAVLERRILLALGTQPDVLAMKNEVGVGLRAAILSELCPPCRDTARRFRLHYGAGGKGAPDLLLSVAGRFGGLELKSDTGRERPEQVAWHAAAARRSMPVIFARTVDEALVFVSGLRTSGARS